MTLLVATPAQPATPAEPAKQSSPLGRLPWIFLSVAAGVMVVSGADALSRTGHRGASLLFWLAMILIIFPAGVRLAGARVHRSNLGVTLKYQQPCLPGGREIPA